jgi:nicotinate-nucleotide adenylyltransferase
VPSPYFIAGLPQRIGLMGGSFNPAHEGHVHVSRLALSRLALHEVWWLVSPQNPLKDADGMAGLDDRVRIAAAVAAAEPRIRVTDIESRIGTRYTADTLDRLLPRFPNLSFVWIMGADNLAQISRWQRWETIFRRVPVAVFARAPYSRSALASAAAKRFTPFRIPPARARDLATMAPPAWSFFHVPVNPQSASRIRSLGAGNEIVAGSG